MQYQDGLAQPSVNLDSLSALRAPVTALLGVSGAVGDLLGDLGVATVLDLATLPVVTVAAELVDAANERGDGPASRVGTVPRGYVDDGAPDDPDALVAAPLTVLRGIDPALAQRFASVAQIHTVADLGRWLPARFARDILAAATGRSADAEPGSELVPRLGEYPTERCFYTTTVIDHVEAQATEDLADAGPVDIAPSVDTDFGFSAPAVGARLTYQQSWFAHGVTLGNLLHSVALAPGESTRIAVVDWSRRTRAGSTEDITESEALSQQMTHNRAVSEVQDAVATEAQSGFSHSQSTAKTSQRGGGFGFSAGPISIGGSASTARTTTTADSFSASFGARELAASMSQKVMDATQQSASSSRERRASLVMEVSEEEHETVSTRILANYNHMHALTVQYYEVVEVYRVAVELSEVERCLFVPMKLVEFDEATIGRYQDALAAAALDRRARELLTGELGLIRLSATVRVRPPLGPLLAGIGLAGRPLVADTTATATAAATAAAAAEDDDGEPQAFAWQLDEIRRAARVTAALVSQPGVDAIFLPRDATLEGVTFESDGGPVPTAVGVQLQGGQPAVTLNRTSVGWTGTGSPRLQELDEITVTAPAEHAFAGRMTLGLSYRGSWFPITVPARVGAGATATACRFSGGDVMPELLDHLNANRLHYSQAILRSLDASTLALLLSRFTFEGLPVADLVDPQPLMVAGNYLVLRMPAFTERAEAPPQDHADTTALSEQRAAWRDWLAERGLEFGARSRTEELVPVPTGGVFAEAVLGRSNAAEKLDATRFWNWQDSPIPLAPPEIAAISMESRAQPVDARPGQLGQPVLNIVNPTALPDPAGLGASLAALQSGSMFRDMSGLAATIGLAQATAGNATGAAASAGQLAADNLRVQAEQTTERMRIAAEMAIAASGNPAGMAGTPKTHSEAGATLNTARMLDKQGVRHGRGTPGGDAPGGDDGVPAGSSGGELGGGDLGGGDVGGGDVDPDTLMPGVDRTVAREGGFTGPAFDRLLWGASGAPAADVILASSGGSQPGAPSKVVDALSAYGTTEDNRGFANEAAEVDAIKDGTWRPASRDFRAIGIRSQSDHRREPVAAGSLMDVLMLFRSPVRRVNLFATDVGGGAITMRKRVGPGSSSSFDPRPDDFDPAATTFDVNTILAMVELHSRYDTLMRSVRARNSQIPDRELWIYLVEGHLDPGLGKGLARLLGFTVFGFNDEIAFVPEFSDSPKKILVRGQIGLPPLGSDARGHPIATHQTRDARTLDSYGVSYSP